MIQAVGQEAEVLTDAAGEVVEEQTLNVIDLFLSGGWIMWILLAMSIYAVYLFFERRRHVLGFYFNHFDKLLNLLQPLLT